MLFLHSYLWIAPHVLIGLCLLLLFRTRLQKQYPAFTAYLLFESMFFLCVVTLDRLFDHHGVSLDTFQWVAVIGNGLLSMLVLAVFYELVNELVSSRPPLAAAIRPILRWTAAVLLLVVAVSSGLLSRWGVRSVVTAFQTLELSVNVVQTGLLLALLVFTRVLRVSWRSLPAGIALGFGITATAEIAAAALLSALGSRNYFRIDTMRMAAFHVSVLVWLTYICLPSKPTGFKGRGPGKSDLEAWHQELQKMVR